MIATVLGEISESKLGVCSSHEHVFIDMRNCVDVTGNEPPCFNKKMDVNLRAEIYDDPYAVLDNALLDEVDKAVFELEYFKAHGGQGYAHVLKTVKKMAIETS